MGLNLQDIHARFNAGISTVAIDSPTGAEMSVVKHIAIEFLITVNARDLNLYSSL